MAVVQETHNTDRKAEPVAVLEPLFKQAAEVGHRHKEMLNGSVAQIFFRKAVETWVPYTPQNNSGTAVGVDSGWQTRLFHGCFLYGLQAVAVDNGGNHVAEPVVEFELASKTEGLFPQLYVEAVAEMREHYLAATVSDIVSAVLVDGSLLARAVKASRLAEMKLIREYIANIRPLLGKKIYFVSKYSQDNNLFEGFLGDVYYINHATSVTGYVEPVKKELRTGGDVWVFYARLADRTPALHFEATQKVTAGDVEKLMDELTGLSVKGYPAVLLNAHRAANFSAELMNMLVEAAGFAVYENVRDVLEPT